MLKSVLLFLNLHCSPFTSHGPHFGSDHVNSRKGKYHMISLRISEVDDLASVGLPTVVEGLQRANAVKEETGDDRPNPLR